MSVFFDEQKEVVKNEEPKRTDLKGTILLILLFAIGIIIIFILDSNSYSATKNNVAYSKNETSPVVKKVIF